MTGIKQTISATAIIAAAAITGCDMLPRHLPVSIDRHVYESTVQLPTNVAVVEPYSGEVLWSMEVPVEHKLTLDFNRSGEFEPAVISGHPATSMSWRLSGPRKESGSVKLPGTPVGMKVSYRQAPEFPEGRTPATLQPRVTPVTPDPAPLEPAQPEVGAEDAGAVGNGAADEAMQNDVEAAEPIEAVDPADAAEMK
jgi:hypothetical protein